MAGAEKCIRSAPVFDEEFRGRLLALFQWRRDVRHFRRDPVPVALLDALLEVACLATLRSWRSIPCGWPLWPRC